MSILVLNAGSSSLKFGLFDEHVRDTLASGLIDWTANPGQADFSLQPKGEAEVRLHLEDAGHQAAVLHAVRFLAQNMSVGKGGKSPIAVVGHRVVHGGTRFRDSIRIDSSVKSGIAQLAELAPLHNPPALEVIGAAERAIPDAPHVAVFDTAFFAALPASAYIYPLPYEWYTDWGIRRFGFHGISHAYCAGRAAELLGREPGRLRLVICHLGNGCSATAVQGGSAIATTMGFTPMEGLMMGSRAGSVDPGILLYVMRSQGLTLEQLDDVLNHGSGLMGISGISSDFRQVEAMARSGHDRARLALEIYAQRVKAAIGALAVTLGGIDALVFTAGVGEHSANLRRAVGTGLDCLGLYLDQELNEGCQPDADIATSASPARTLVIHTCEEFMIAREASRVALGILPSQPSSAAKV